MEFEHFAINVQTPQDTANWYVANLGMKIVKGSPMFFLADRTGRVVIELYNNPAAPIPNYADQHPLMLHFAFKVTDAETLKNKLIGAGATLVNENHHPDGSHLVMLRDPWGLALQLCQRAVPLV